MRVTVCLFFVLHGHKFVCPVCLSMCAYVSASVVRPLMNPQMNPKVSHLGERAVADLASKRFFAAVDS